MLVYPKFYCDNVRQITLDFLKENDIKFPTLSRNEDVYFVQMCNYLAKRISDGTQEWVENLKKEGIKFCIVSNSNKLEKVSYVAEKLKIPYFHFAKKPFKKGFLKEIAEETCQTGRCTCRILWS